jgi:NAD-dependent dihydropyrimidine dehydrogenase PreA subunit
MLKREIITIDEEKCTGCGLCVPGCPEGALQIIDGKARLVSDLMCDGLGACIGDCPEGAIAIVEREAEPYDEAKVMHNIIQAGPNTIRAHLKHLKDHGQTEFYDQAIAILQDKKIEVPMAQEETHQGHSGCPGSQNLAFDSQDNSSTSAGPQPSQLKHWPIQMHLISPSAPHYQGSDLLLAADCVAFSMGDFHSSHLSGKTLAIACPKLDEGQSIYLEKLKALVDEAHINTLTVMIMQVPCCGGLLQMAQMAVEQSSRKVPIKAMVVGLQGEVLREEWV